MDLATQERESLPRDFLPQKKDLSGESPPFFLGLHFVGKKKICALHASLFGDPSSTDCITVPYEDSPCLGEIFVCPDVASQYAKTEGKELYTEITLYVVHGFLHLCGFDDLEDASRKIMRKEEERWMLTLAQKRLLITR